MEYAIAPNMPIVIREELINKLSILGRTDFSITQIKETIKGVEELESIWKKIEQYESNRTNPA
jgi:hypothetical protein